MVFYFSFFFTKNRRKKLETPGFALFSKFSPISRPRVNGDPGHRNYSRSHKRPGRLLSLTTQCGGSKLFVARRDNPICSCWRLPTHFVPPRFYRRSCLFLRHRRERFRMIDSLHSAGKRLTSVEKRLNSSRRICAVGLSVHKWNIRSTGRRAPRHRVSPLNPARIEILVLREL